MPDTNENKINHRPIGVFDSGVGGLSVLRELQNLLPNEDFIFLADQQHIPYGEKSKKTLVKIVYGITDYLISKQNIKMMVVACNTATCNTLEELRENYTFPIVGTVPAIKLAAEKTKTGTVAIISTPSTSKSKVLLSLIKDYCSDINVLNIGCKNLENVVEDGDIDSPKVNKLLLKYLESVGKSDADFLVLGCTHYPFLKKSIQKIVGPSVTLQDGGKAIAKQTKSLLIKHRMKNGKKIPSKTIYFTTGNPVKFSRVAGALLKKIIQVRKVKI